jgi:uncharacterized damage-inducible protein DinB
MLTDLIQLYTRDLDRLKNEIDAFQNEGQLWQLTGHVKNTAGNLCLHLVGNLNTYIGKNLGGTSYVRNREAEFSLKDVPREELIAQLVQTKADVIVTLEKMQEEDLAHPYPENVLGYEMSTGFFLIHLAAHLSYHMGQINYLRRIL